LGEEVLVTISRTGFNIKKDQITEWILLFGVITQELVYKTHDGLPHLKEDNLEVFVKLRKHIPPILPAFGRKLFIKYRGQPIMCNSCYEIGHIKKTCPKTSITWIEHVRSVIESGIYPTMLLGNWIKN